MFLSFHSVILVIILSLNCPMTLFRAFRRAPVLAESGYFCIDVMLLFKIPKIFRWCYYFCVWLSYQPARAWSSSYCRRLSSCERLFKEFFFIMSLLILYEEFFQRAAQTVLPSQWSVTTENLLKWCIKCWLFVLKCMCAVNAADELLSSSFWVHKYIFFRERRSSAILIESLRVIVRGSLGKN